MKRFQGWIGLLLMTAFCLGCGGAQDPDAKNGKADGTTSTQSSLIPPNEIVAMFGDSIRRGDRDAAFKLITPAAREEIRRRGIELDPPGSAEASYQIGEVRYLDDTKTLAGVASMWIEPGEVGQPKIETEVVWLVHLGQEGWRISGLAIDQGKDEKGEELPALLVDFEDLENAIQQEGQPASDKTAGPTTTEATAVNNPAAMSPPAGLPPMAPPQVSTQMAPPSGFAVPNFQSPPVQQDPNAAVGFGVPAIAAPQGSQSGNTQLR